MEKLIMPNHLLLPEIAEMIAEGMTVTLKGKGNSMRPFIVGGRDSVVLSRACSLRLGDIVLAKTTDKRYVLHRIIQISGDDLTLMGDGNLKETEQTTTADVLAKVVKIIRKDCSVDADSLSERRKAAIWKALLPIRRWLIAIYVRCK